MLWHEMSWPEINAVDHDLPVVIPLGACEQHAHHLPVLVDTIQIEAMARDVEARLPSRMLLTPTMWIGSSHHHKDFPGTISVTPILYAQLVQQIASSVLNAGFRRILFLNGHGGNRAPANTGLTELIANDNRADAAEIAMASWWDVASDELGKTGVGQQTIGHSCEFETSLMLEFRADLVHMDRVQPPSAAMESEWFMIEGNKGSKVERYHRFHRFTASGSLGNAGAATEEKGKRLRKAIADEITRFIQDFAAWPRSATIGPR